MSLFIANYKRKLRIGVDVRKKEKMEKAIEFAKRMKKVQEEARAIFKRVQKEMKWQVDSRRKEAEVWEVEEKVILSTKDLVFKERPAKKLVDQYVGPYIIDKVVSTNVVKLQLLISMWIHLIVNISWVVWYKKQVGGQRIEKVKPVEVEEVKE